VIAAARRGGARFSITARMNPTVVKAISGIHESAWVPIHYPNAIWDEDEQRLISDAEVAEVPFTAFTSRRKADHISARLIVRRVRRLNPKSVADGQGELFPGYRHHGVFTDSPLTTLQAEKSHRAHAIVEQVIADLKSGALTQLPSGSFAANSAWLVLAAIAFNLTRAAGALASVFHAKATTATIHRQLIMVPGRLARSARRLVIHLPKDWPWHDSWEGHFNAACGPPAPGRT
jgi:Transposase DDE domain group 1